MRGLYQNLIDYKIYYLYSDIKVENGYIKEFNINSITSSELEVIEKNLVKLKIRFRKKIFVSKVINNYKANLINFYFYNLKLNKLVKVSIDHYISKNRGSHIELTSYYNIEDVNNFLSLDEN